MNPKLGRADVEWLLATLNGGKGPIDWASGATEESYAWLRGLDLRGADLRNVNLSGLPLTYLRAGCTEVESYSGTPDQVERAAANLEGTNLNEAHLEGAFFGDAHLQHASFKKAHLEGAYFGNAHLESAHFGEAYLDGADFGVAFLQDADFMDARARNAGFNSARLDRANLWRTWLHGADLGFAHLEGAITYGTRLGSCKLDDKTLARIRKWIPDMPAVLRPANLRMAYFDSETDLRRIFWSEENYEGPALADVHWGDINLTVADWTTMHITGDEVEARQTKLFDGSLRSPEGMVGGFQSAVRTYRQLATLLSAQGIVEDAGRFAYRAQLLQREVFRRQHAWGRWLSSWAIGTFAGYGFGLRNVLLAYIASLIFFAAAYLGFGHIFGPPLQWYQALLVSLTAIHGRVFFEQFGLNSALSWVAAFESVVGIVIEGVFVAMLIQKFFSR